MAPQPAPLRNFAHRATPPKGTDGLRGLCAPASITRLARQPVTIQRCAPEPVRYSNLYFLTDRVSARSPGSCAYNAGAPSDSGFVKSTQKTTVPIQQT